MPSGWEIYYVVFLSAGLALGIPFVLWLLSRVFQWGIDPAAWNSGNAGKDSRNPPENPLLKLTENISSLGAKNNTRFFLAANVAVVLIALMIALIPSVSALKARTAPVLILRGLGLIISTAGFAALGLLYAARKGDLGWLGTFNKKKDSV